MTQRIHPIGISAHLDKLNTSDCDTQLNLMQTAGIHWVRVEFNWSNLENTQTVFTWSVYDHIVTGILARGMQCIGLLTQYNAPEWARGLGTQFNTIPTPSLYASWAASVAAHYAGQVAIWEVGNEPNVDLFWNNANDPVGYTALLQAAYPAIKAADSTCSVMSAGLANLGAQGATYCQTMYQNGAHGYMDYIGYHPYSQPNSPDYIFPGGTCFSNLDNIYALMQSYGDGAKQIIVTEVGWPSSTLSSGGVTEAVQATYTARIFTKVMYETYQYVAIVCMYDFVDDGTDLTFNEDNFGLLHTDLSQKAAYASLQAAQTNYKKDFVGGRFSSLMI